MISFSIKDPQAGRSTAASRRTGSGKGSFTRPAAEESDKPARENPFFTPSSRRAANGRISFTSPARTAKEANPFLAPAQKKPSGAFEFPLSPPGQRGEPSRTKPSSGFFPEGIELGAGDEAAASGGRVSTSPVPLTLSSLSAAQTAALAALPAGANAAFAHVWSVLDSSRFAKEQLLLLLDKGALAAKEGQPNVLETLRDLTEKPRVDGVDGGLLTRQVVTALANPDETVFQGKRYTCSVANVERQLAEDPLAFSKVVEGLSSPKGEAVLPTGDILKRAEGSLPDDGAGRSDADRLIQGAFMTMANGKGIYRPQTDKFENDDVPGLKPLEIGRITAAIEGKDQVVVVHDSGTHIEFERLVRTHGPNDSFQLGVSWKGTDHMVLLTRVEGDTAHFFDPAAHSAGSMPVADILFKSQFALLAADQVDPSALPEDAMYWFRRSEKPAP